MMEAQVMDSVTMDDFITRFQSIRGVPAGTSGIGSQVEGGGNPISATEPATWAMLLLGFGLVGSMMR